MAKTSGLGAGFFLDEFDLSGDIGSLQTISSKRAALDVTAVNKNAMERILGLGDGLIEFVAYHNPSAGQAHATLSALPTTDVLATYANGSAVGDATASITGKQADYTGNRGADGSYVHDSSVMGSGENVDWGVLLTTGRQTFATGTVNGTTYDGTAASTNGAAAYLHVITMPSGTATFTIEDSGNGSAWTAVSGLTFTDATAATSERLEVTGNIARYVRVSGSGTHGNADIVVAFSRY